MSRALAAQCALVLALVAGCAPDSAPAAGTPSRAGRFGSLRDFVLIERHEQEPLFVDRFEVTRGDWAEFASASAGRAVSADAATLDGDPSLPVGNIDLRQARAFARWRFARLPQRNEWEAAVGDGRHQFPWGSKNDPTRANTGELGLGEPVPVGTFEAGRRTGGDQPYDLIGNVGEWTESVAFGWTASALDPAASCMVGRDRALRTPAWAVWGWPGGLVPLVVAAAAGGDRVPREVVGSDFQSPMGATVEPVFAGDRRLRLGLRLYTTPSELLGALLASDVRPRAEDLEQLRRFVRRGPHRAALAAAWVREPRSAAANVAVHDVLRDEIAP